MVTTSSSELKIAQMPNEKERRDRQREEEKEKRRKTVTERTNQHTEITSFLPNSPLMIRLKEQNLTHIINWEEEQGVQKAACRPSILLSTYVKYDRINVSILLGVLKVFGTALRISVHFSSTFAFVIFRVLFRPRSLADYTYTPPMATDICRFEYREF